MSVVVDPELREVIQPLAHRGIARVVKRDDGTIWGTNGRRMSRDVQSVDLADVRVLRRHRLLGVDLLSVF